MPLGFYVDQEFSMDSFEPDPHDTNMGLCYILSIYTLAMPFVILWEIIEIAVI